MPFSDARVPCRDTTRKPGAVKEKARPDWCAVRRFGTRLLSPGPKIHVFLEVRLASALLSHRCSSPETTNVTQDSIRQIVDQHSCVVSGVRYDFGLQWAAVEQECDPMVAAHLLRVEVAARGEAADRPLPLHVFAWMDRLSELPALLTDALHERLAAAHTAGAAVGVTSGAD